MEEYAALVANQTWDLVPRPPGANVVTASGSGRTSGGPMVPWSGTRLVGFFGASLNAPESDYDETFSPVVKPATVRTVL